MKNGICRLCGQNGPLSFEHIPPKSAFNGYGIVATQIHELLQHPENPQREQFPNGIGAYTLCVGCNNITGRWYGQAFIDFAKQAFEQENQTGFYETVDLEYKIYPLKVLKQIVCLFLSLNPPEFGEKNPLLRSFVFKKFANEIPEPFELWAYYSFAPRGRASPLSARIGVFDSKTTSIFSELVYPPFGFCLSTDRAPHPDMQKLNFLARYELKTLRKVPLRLPILPVFGPMPGDYRTEEDIKQGK